MASAGAGSELLEETRDGVRILRLNRPARKNALTDALGWAIVEAFERAGRDDAARATAQRRAASARRVAAT